MPGSSNMPWTAASSLVRPITGVRWGGRLWRRSWSPPSNKSRRMRSEERPPASSAPPRLRPPRDAPWVSFRACGAGVARGTRALPASLEQASASRETRSHEALRASTPLRRVVPGGELVEDDAQREYVARAHRRLAARLFGRHVAWRADNDAGTGARASAGASCGGRSRRADAPRRSRATSRSRPRAP